jgi:hypothetical protein
LGLCEQHGVFRIRIPIEGFRSHLSSGGDRSVPLALAGLILRGQVVCSRQVIRYVSEW